MVAWSPERIDDLARLVYANDSRLDQVEKLATAADEATKRLSTTGDRRAEDTRSLRMIVLTVIAGDIGLALLHLLGVG